MDVHRGRASTAIFNTLGQHVAMPVSAGQEAGYYEVRFDGADLPSGVYLDRMQAGEFVSTKKFLLTR